MAIRPIHRVCCMIWDLRICADWVSGVSRVPREGGQGSWDRRGSWRRRWGASALVTPFGGLGGSRFLSGSGAGTCIDVLGCGLRIQGSILARLEAATVGVGILYASVMLPQNVSLDVG